MRSALSGGRNKSEIRRRSLVSTINHWIWGAGYSVPAAPGTITGMYEWFRPTSSTVGYDASSNMVLTGLSPYGQKYYSTSSTKNPTFTAPNILDFDNTDDELNHLLRPVFISKTKVPDLSDSIAGKGFTNTGLTYDASRGTFWIINEGRSNSGDGTYDPSIIELSLDLTTKINEYRLLSAIPTIQSVQGITIDTSNNTLWIASLLEDKLYNFTKAGVFQSGNTITVAAGAANGLAYDPTLDEFWVCYGNTIKRYNRAGTNTFTLGSLSLDLDLLHLDNTARLLYITYGSNGFDPNFVGIYDISNARFYQQIYLLSEVKAIEGITFVGTTMYINSDEYFHTVGDLLNVVAKYNVEIYLGDIPQATSMMWGGVFKSDAVDAGGDIFWSQHSTGDNRPGITIFSQGLTELRFQAETSVGTSEKSTLTSTITSMANYSVFSIIYDVVNGDVTVYQNGTQVGQSLVFLPVSPMRMIPGKVGNWISTPRYSQMKMKEYLFYVNNIGTSDRQKLEGYLAWQHGLQSGLPGGHPYKNAAP